MRVVILGAGVAGLVTAYTFKRFGIPVTVYSDSFDGGDFLSGGPRCVVRTSRTVRLVESLEEPFSEYRWRAGILLRDDIQRADRAFEEMSMGQADRIKSDYWRKSRGTDPTFADLEVAIEPIDRFPTRAIRFDYASVMETLRSEVGVHLSTVKAIRPGSVRVGGVNVGFDRCVVTLPQWTASRLATFWLPVAVASKMIVAQVAAKRDRYIQWDSVLTPYTPTDTVYRFTSDGYHYYVEANIKGLDDDDLAGDLSFLFPDGYYVESIREFKGHPIPTDDLARWPGRVKPVGRYAEWKAWQRTAGICDRAAELLEVWFDINDGEPVAKP